MLSQYLITSIFYRTLTCLFKVLKAKLCWTLFSGPLIIVIALLRVLIYYKMPLERTEQCWILYLNFGCNIIQQHHVSHLVHLSSHIF